jgi:dTDP-4-dehydrorhamnose 3,5-epimerase
MRQDGHLLGGAIKDSQLIDEQWRKIPRSLDGVAVHEVRHVPRDHGVLTEIYRPAWDRTGLPVVQIYQSRLFAGALGAWSCHAKATDRLFVSEGHLKVVLYDARSESTTAHQLLEVHVGEARPALVVIPPGVWHGLQNLGASDAIVLNLPTVAYAYDDPDHYRLPYDSPAIPYRWNGGVIARKRSDGASRGGLGMDRAT